MTGVRNCGRLALRLAAVLAAAAGAAAAPEVVVATWNVENYVAENRLVDGVYREGYPKPEAAKAALRAAVREIGPDVLALQEMGPAGYLEELQRDLAAEGAAYPHAALVEGPDAKRHVAVLSRVPLLRVVPHADLPCKGSAGGGTRVRRGVLEVAVAAGGGEVTLFILHLKSRVAETEGDREAAQQRAAEAEAVRDLVLRRHPDPSVARFLVLGDCNDAPRSRPLRALAGRGRTPIAEPLPAADDRGDVWTHFHRTAGVYARVDYILASPGARGLVAGGRARIHDAPAVRAASDHRPVVVRLGAE